MDILNQFISKSQQIHNDKYDYSKVNYINTKQKVTIICNKCKTEFQQTPNNHLHNQGCKLCYNRQTQASDQFVQKAQQIHNDKYNYSNVIYVTATQKITIICNKCKNEFQMRPNNHLNRQGCKLCYNIQAQAASQFVKKAQEIHGDKYDYSKVNYIKNTEKIIIICKKCKTEFQQTPNSHLQKCGCGSCGYGSKQDTNQFIQNAQKIHGDNYDYSKVDYTQSKQKVIIICKKCKTEFMQRPNNHLQGRGCNLCFNVGYSKIQIEWITHIMQTQNIYIQHALNGGEFQIPQTKYKADGYCKETNTVYEMNGDFWHGNPNIYNSNDYNPVSKKTFGELYEYTQKRKQEIIDLGYNYEEIWESDWQKYMIRN